MNSVVFPIVSPLRRGSALTDMKVGRCALQRCLLVQSILKNTDWFRPVCVCMPPGVNPSTDPCQPSSHLALPGNDSGERNPPQSLLCSLKPPTPHIHTHTHRHTHTHTQTHTQPSDVLRCGPHLPVSPSHAVSSEKLSVTNWRVAGPRCGRGHVQYGGGCHSYMWRKQRGPYWHNITVLVVEVHRMRRTRWAVMTE